jgi:alcohol dehydrogenase class IV
LSYLRNSCASKLAIILQVLSKGDPTLSEEQASVKCIGTLVRLMKDVDIPQTPGGFGIPETTARQLTRDAIQQKRLLGCCPK